MKTGNALNSELQKETQVDNFRKCKNDIVHHVVILIWVLILSADMN